MQGPKLGKTIAGFYNLRVYTETFIISEGASGSIPIWFSLCSAFQVWGVFSNMVLTIQFLWSQRAVVITVCFWRPV